MAQTQILTKIEWWDVCRVMRPTLTWEEFELMWEEFQAYKRKRKLQ